MELEQLEVGGSIPLDLLVWEVGTYRIAEGIVSASQTVWSRMTLR
jgi:hypothetical protein